MGARRLDRRPAGGRLARALLPVPHRARRSPRPPAPHRAPGLLGAEGGVPRRRGLPRHAAGASPSWRRGCAIAAAASKDADAARVVPRLADGRQLRDPRRRCATRSGPTASRTPTRRRALGVFKDPTLLPVVFPGLMEVQRTHLRPAATDERIIDIDYCPNAQAIHHLEPIDDIVIREWGPDGTLAGVDAAARPPGQGRAHRQAAGRPADAREADVAARAAAAPRRTRTPTARRARSSTTCRGASCSTPTPPSLKTLIDRMVYMSSDNEIVVTTRTGPGLRDGVGRVLGPALLAPRRGGPEADAERGLRPDLVQHLGRLRRRSPCSSSTSTEPTLEHPIDVDAGPRHRRARDLDLGGSRRRHPRADLRPGRGPAPLHALHPQRDRAAACTASRPAPRTCRRICGGSRRSRRSSRRTSASTPPIRRR